MFQLYLFAFCKIVVAIVFALSCFSKFRDFSQFIETIRNFRLLPPFIIPFSASLFLSSELLVIVLLFTWPFMAFLLGASLLLIFSVALATVLMRKIQTPCHCFGHSKQLISSIDFIRNFGFLLCTGSGLWIASKPAFATELSPLNMGIIFFAALAFVLIWTQIGEIYELFQPELR